VQFAPSFEAGSIRDKRPREDHQESYNGGMDSSTFERVVDMTGVLQRKDLALQELLGRLLEVGTEGFETPVEIEWAVNLAQNPGELHEFVLLQTRPMSMWKREAHLGIEPGALPDASQSFFASKRALGNGRVRELHDVVFVHPDDFPKTPAEMAEAVNGIGELNTMLLAAKRGYVLMCPGRFGTQREGMGIPVQWPHINGSKVMVETDIKGLDVPPSEGTHFFQNIASFGIGYVTVHVEDGHVQYDWLKTQVKSKKGCVCHAVFEEPLEVVLDGMTSCAVGMMPGADFSSVVAQSSAFVSLNNGQFSSL
jgi:hypothetical protein